MVGLFLVGDVDWIGKERTLIYFSGTTVARAWLNSIFLVLFLCKISGSDGHGLEFRECNTLCSLVDTYHNSF